MKKKLLFILHLLIAVAVSAQKPFEGRINYLLTSKDSSIQLSVKATFRKQKILFDMQVLRAPAMMEAKNERIILDFRNGFIDRIHEAEKVIQREPLTGPKAKKDLPVFTRSTESLRILGFDAVAWVTPEFRKTEIKDSVATELAGQVKIWYAPSLRFPIPEEMKQVQMVPLFSNGFVALGSTISLRVGDMSLLLHTKADMIMKGKIKPATFDLYKGYRIEVDD